jgi:hypothetical protein
MTIASNFSVSIFRLNWLSLVDGTNEPITAAGRPLVDGLGVEYVRIEQEDAITNKRDVDQFNISGRAQSSSVFVPVVDDEEAGSFLER